MITIADAAKCTLSSSLAQGLYTSCPVDSVHIQSTGHIKSPHIASAHRRGTFTQ